MAEIRRRQQPTSEEADYAEHHADTSSIELSEAFPLAVVWMALFCDYMLMTAVDLTGICPARV